MVGGACMAWGAWWGEHAWQGGMCGGGDMRGRRACVFVTGRNEVGPR